MKLRQFPQGHPTLLLRASRRPCQPPCLRRLNHNRHPLQQHRRLCGWHCRRRPCVGRPHRTKPGWSAARPGAQRRPKWNSPSSSLGVPARTTLPRKRMALSKWSRRQTGPRAMGTARRRRTGQLGSRPAWSPPVDLQATGPLCMAPGTAGLARGSGARRVAPMVPSAATATFAQKVSSRLAGSRRWQQSVHRQTFARESGEASLVRPLTIKNG
mmetsp:Transcript_65161/g.151332  ORF Transcript_65161/g.151332 Transcript_65161/m.151332 type:complete len:213 (-) Transcript_65161:99-737(-)